MEGELIDGGRKRVLVHVYNFDFLSRPGTHSAATAVMDHGVLHFLGRYISFTATAAFPLSVAPGLADLEKYHRSFPLVDLVYLLYLVYRVVCGGRDSIF